MLSGYPPVINILPRGRAIDTPHCQNPTRFAYSRKSRKHKKVSRHWNCRQQAHFADIGGCRYRAVPRRVRRDHNFFHTKEKTQKRRRCAGARYFRDHAASPTLQRASFSERTVKLSGATTTISPSFSREAVQIRARLEMQRKKSASPSLLYNPQQQNHQWSPPPLGNTKPTKLARCKTRFYLKHFKIHLLRRPSTGTRTVQTFGGKSKRVFLTA